MNSALLIIAENPSDPHEFKPQFAEFLPPEALFWAKNLIYVRPYMISGYRIRRPSWKTLWAAHFTSDTHVCLRRRTTSHVCEGDRLSRKVNSNRTICVPSAYPKPDVRSFEQWAEARTSIISPATAEETTRNRVDTHIGAKVDSVSKHFSSKGLQTGILAQSRILNEVRKSSVTYCDNKDFSEIERVQLLIYVLKGPELNFSTTNVKDANMQNLNKAFNSLSRKFDTTAHQRQIVHYQGVWT